MQRTRTTPVGPAQAGVSSELQPVATGVPIETRPDTPETRAEDEQSEQELAAELAQGDPPDDTPADASDDEVYRRQERNRKFWKDCVLTILPRNSDEDTIVEMADKLTMEYDRRMEAGWFGHQHEEFFNEGGEEE